MKNRFFLHSVHRISDVLKEYSMDDRYRYTGREVRYQDTNHIYPDYNNLGIKHSMDT